MPFMLGRSPVRRTLNYLESGAITLRTQVHVVGIGYHKSNLRSHGTREFIFWHWAQLQFKNPDVQLLKWVDLSPNPFIQVFLANGEELLMDIDFYSRQEIHDRLQKILGKTKFVSFVIKCSCSEWCCKSKQCNVKSVNRRQISAANASVIACAKCKDNNRVRLQLPCPPICVVNGDGIRMAPMHD